VGASGPCASYNYFVRVCADTPRRRYSIFFLLALTIHVADSAVTRSIADPSRRALVSAAASADVILVVSLLYYWLLVRPGIRSSGSLSFIALLGCLHATYFWPSAGSLRLVFAASCESGVIALIAVGVLRAKRKPQSDPLDTINSALASGFLPPPVARMLAAEFGTLYYALFTWRSKAHAPSDAEAFSIHRQSGQADLLSGLALAGILEIVPVHLVLHRWTAAGAWIATASSIYAVIWLFGLSRSIQLRPVLVGPDYLDLRYGVLFRLIVEPHHIARVSRFDPADAPGAAILPKGSQPNLCIELTQEQMAEGLFGIRRRVKRIALAADNPLALEQALVRL